MSHLSGVPAEQSDRVRHLESAPPDWFAAGSEGEGLAYYLAILRSNFWVIVVAVVVSVGAALLYLVQAEKVYQAQADLLITPVPSDSTTLIGLGLPRQSSDPSRDVQTIARLIETPAVARRVITSLDLDVPIPKLLADVDATPVAQSNVVTVTARASSPDLAARIANAFGNASVAYRTDRLHEQLDIVIPRLRTQLNRLGSSDAASRQVLTQQLLDLEALRVLSDPTLRLETPAEPDSEQVAPRPMLSIAAAILGGLLLGVAVSLGSQLLDPRLRREEQLRRYRIPILARIPLERRASRGSKATPVLPRSASPATHDAYAVLSATLSVSRVDQNEKCSVLVTGPGSGDGKTSTAINLASMLADGDRAVLVEYDTRRPTLARAFRAAPKYSASTVVARRVRFEDALVPLDSGMPRLRALLQIPGDSTPAPPMRAANAEWLIRQAHQHADWLVIDAPPLALVSETLPLAKQVDDVILVVRIGNTRLKALAELAELLVQQGITPAGFVVVGDKQAPAYYGS